MAAASSPLSSTTAITSANERNGMLPDRNRHARSGMTILQGFATISGGNTGSRLITSTKTAPAAYTIKLSEPGEQGTPGKLTFRIQVVPKPG